MARRARRTMGNRLQSLSVSRLHGQSCAIFSDIRSWHSKGKLYEAPEACFDYVSEKDLCKMIGNSVPVPLIGEIMQEAMFAAGLISEKNNSLLVSFSWTGCIGQLGCFGQSLIHRHAWHGAAWKKGASRIQFFGWLFLAWLSLIFHLYSLPERSSLFLKKLDIMSTPNDAVF